MRRTSLARSQSPLVPGLFALVALSACTMKEAESPAPPGPSGFGLSISLVAKPDVVPQDGFSQVTVVIDARNANGEPDRGRSLVVRSRCQNGQEFGQLSASSVVTGSDGKATVVYLPPSGFTACSCDLSQDLNYVTIEALPADPNYAGAAPRSTRIRLAPQMPDPVPGAPIAASGSIKLREVGGGRIVPGETRSRGIAADALPSLRLRLPQFHRLQADGHEVARLLSGNRFDGHRSSGGIEGAGVASGADFAAAAEADSKTFFFFVNFMAVGPAPLAAAAEQAPQGQPRAGHRLPP